MSLGFKTFILCFVFKFCELFWFRVNAKGFFYTCKFNYLLNQLVANGRVICWDLFNGLEYISEKIC